MKKLKSFLFFVVVILSCLTVRAEDKLGTITIKVNEVKTITLNSTYSNVLHNASNINFRWYSNNTNLATVSYYNYNECRITGKAEGTCRIYFEASFFINNKYDRYNYYWELTVSGHTSGGSTTNVEPQSATVYTDEITLEVGQTYSLSYSVSPTNADIKEKVWMSYEEDVAIVDDQGNITALSPGKARIFIWIYGQSNIVGDACVVNVVPATRIFNEESEETPLAINDANVTVNRIIHADKWSTICLPFAMSEAQTKTAFGDDVEIADFTGYDAERNTGGDVVGLTVNFSDVTAMEANHPYIIKVKDDISQFTVDGVDVDPVANPMSIYDNGLTGAQQVIYGSFIGTYVAETTIPRNALFISDNKFWYSNGSKKMKAFRAYFVLQDVLADIDNQGQQSRISMSFNNESSGVKDVTRNVPASNVYYDLQGRRIQKLTKGLYINNGKIIKK